MRVHACVRVCVLVGGGGVRGPVSQPCVAVADPKGDPYFLFHPNGSIYATRELNFEGTDPLMYFVDMTLTDDGTPPLNYSFTLQINVTNMVW